MSFLIMVYEVKTVDIRDISKIEKNYDFPLKITGLLTENKLGYFNIENIIHLIGSRCINFKIGKRWKYMDENDCLYLEGTLDDVLKWVDGKPSSFSELKSDECWIYADYKNFCDLFDKDLENLYERIDWSFVGETNKKAENTTIWIGTTDAYTPLHYDSYGYNFHTVTSGCKEWKLFSPNDSANLYPTRIPYEESSVYSKIDLFSPNLAEFPLFQNTKMYQTYVKPGEILYIPYHWWHFVRCTEMTVSLNIWCETKYDELERLKEAITRMLVSSWKNFENQDKSFWLNPNEISVDFEQALKYINYSVGEIEKTHHKIEGDEILSHIISEGILNAICQKLLEKRNYNKK